MCCANLLAKLRTLSPFASTWVMSLPLHEETHVLPIAQQAGE